MSFLSDVGSAWDDCFSWGSLIKDAESGFSGPEKPDNPFKSLPTNLFGPSGANMDSDVAGIKSNIQGPTPPPPNSIANSDSIGSQVGKGLSDGIHSLVRGGSSMAADALKSAGSEGVSAVMQNIFHKNDAAKQGQATRAYLANAFPQLNPWERAGAGGSMAGIQEQGFSNTKQLTKMQLDNQKDIAHIQADTAKSIAGINAVTSRANTSDSVFAQNSMLTYNQKQAQVQINKTMADTDLSVQQKAESIARTYTQYLQAHGVQLTNEQIPVITNHIRSQIENTDADTVNKKGPQSALGKDVNDVVRARYLGDVGSSSSSDKVDPSGLSIGDPMAIFAPVVHRNASNFHGAAGVRSSMSRK